MNIVLFEYEHDTIFFLYYRIRLEIDNLIQIGKHDTIVAKLNLGRRLLQSYIYIHIYIYSDYIVDTAILEKQNMAESCGHT